MHLTALLGGRSALLGSIIAWRSLPNRCQFAAPPASGRRQPEPVG